MVSGEKWPRLNKRIYQMLRLLLLSLSLMLGFQAETKTLKTDVLESFLENGDLELQGNGTGKVQVNGKFSVASTSFGSNPCPTMTEAQRDAIVLPGGGDCVFNSDTQKLNVYNFAISEWGEVGGGGGGSGFQELMVDPSFENETEEGVLDTATSDYIVSPTLGAFDKKALEVTFSGAGSYCVTKTTGANFAGLPSQVSCQVQTSDSGISFEHYSNGNLIASEDVLSDNSVRKYQPLVQGVIGTTSEGWCVRSTGAATAVINNCKVSTAGELQNVGIDSDWEDCGLVAADFTAFGTIASIDDRCRRDGPDLLMDVKVTTSSAASASEARMNIKISGNSLSSKSDIASIRSAGIYFYGATSATHGGAVLITGSQSYVTFSNTGVFGGSSTNPLSSANGDTVTASGATNHITARIPIANWSAGQDALSSTIQTESASYSGHAGYGSTDTKIAYMTTTNFNRVSHLGTIANDSTNGWRFTANKTVSVVISYMGSMAAAEDQLGISLNSNQLTSNIFNITSSHRAGYDIPGSAGQIAFVLTEIDMVNGDILRLHNSGAAVGNAELRVKVKPRDVQFNATLRDTPKEPNSFNGKPKICKYRFGGTSATLAVPTSCTSSPCVEVTDSCGATAPTRASTGAYTDLTFQNNTFAANSPLDCRCTAFATGTNQKQNCAPYFITGDDTWKANANGGAVINLNNEYGDGTPNDAYVTVVCEGYEP